MSISFPVSHPTSPGFRRSAFRMINVVGSTRSPFSLDRQVQRHQGEGWEADLTLPPMKRVKASQWQAFFASLQSEYGTFLLGDPDGTEPLGVATGTPLADSSGSPSVNLARQRELYTKGWTPNTSGILLRGSWLQLGTGEDARLHMTLSDASSDSGGFAVLDIWPALYVDIQSDAQIVIHNAKGCFSLSGNPGWDSNEARVFGFSFTAYSV